MADNILDVSKASQQEVAAVNKGKWSFLKRAVSFGRKSFDRITTSSNRQEKSIVTPKDPGLAATVKIPKGSGLSEMLRTMEVDGRQSVSSRMRLLYPEFLQYMNEDLVVRYQTQPLVLQGIREQLNSGNKEMIEMFSRVLADRFAQQLKTQRHQQREVSHRLNSSFVSLGYKKREAEVLAFEMNNLIKLEENRDSRADYASRHLDWKIVLAKPQVSNRAGFNSLLEGVKGLDDFSPNDTLPANPQR